MLSPHWCSQHVHMCTIRTIPQHILGKRHMINDEVVINDLNSSMPIYDINPRVLRSKGNMNVAVWTYLLCV